MPIRLRISCSSKELASENRLVGAFRGVDEDFLVQPGDCYKPEWASFPSSAPLVGVLIEHNDIQQVGAPLSMESESYKNTVVINLRVCCTKKVELYVL